MVKLFALAAVLLTALLLPAAHAEEEKQPLALREFSEVESLFYRNPHLSGVADPFVFSADGVYYMVATTGGANFVGYQTDSLAHWPPSARFTAMRPAPWAGSDHWAPEVYEYNGRLCMFFSARGKGAKDYCRLGVAFAEKAGDRFICQETPLLDLGYTIIDASLLVDDDGTPYIFYSANLNMGDHYESITYGVEMQRDLSGMAGEPVKLIEATEPWETRTGQRVWAEGGVVQKHDGLYYLYYSCNVYSGKDYSVGVATAKSPLGPYEKYAGNPILTYQQAGDGSILVSGPGHNSFFTVGEETFSAYHTHCKPNALPSTRQLCYDRSGYHADGTAYICGPSLGWQLLPLADLGRQNLSPLADAPAALTDGDTCVSASSRPYAWQGTQADFVWASPAEAELIQIYPAGYLGKGTLLVNGCYEAQLDFSACRDVPGGSIILPLAQPMALSSLRISLAEEGTLGEVVVLSTQSGAKENKSR